MIWSLSLLHTGTCMSPGVTLRPLHLSVRQRCFMYSIISPSELRYRLGICNKPLITHRKRRRILKNSERLAKAGPNPPGDIQDQGFTRPSVLILVPFRSSALRWVAALTSHTPSPSYQIENHARFQAEYGLPPDAVDKLAEAPAGVYPRDHVEMFKGNVDDSFRLGIKVTRKSLKLFSEFHSCDVIIASPLGLRISIEKEKYVTLI